MGGQLKPNRAKLTNQKLGSHGSLVRFVPLTTQRAAAWHGGACATATAGCAHAGLLFPLLPRQSTTGDGRVRRRPRRRGRRRQPASLVDALPGAGRGTDRGRGPPHHQPHRPARAYAVTATTPVAVTSFVRPPRRGARRPALRPLQGRREVARRP